MKITKRFSYLFLISVSSKIQPIALLLLITIFTPFSLSAQSYLFKIGTGDITGVYYPIGGIICRFVSQLNETAPVCLPESTNGSVDNLERLLDNRVHAAIVQSDIANTAFKKNPQSSLRALVPLHKESFTIIAGQHTKIRTFDDLKGKVVNVGVLDSGNFTNTIRLLDSLNLTMNYFQRVTYLSPIDAVAALCEGKIDATVYMVGHPNQNIRESLSRCRGNLVTLSTAQVNKVTTLYNDYIPAHIPSIMYGKKPSVNTFGLEAVLVTNSNLPEETAYHLTAAIIENFPKLKSAHPAFKHMKKQDMLRITSKLPQHTGAKRFFKEQGIITE